MAVYSGECGYCHRKSHLYHHHRVPISKGGNDSPTNKTDICRQCHKLLDDLAVYDDLILDPFSNQFILRGLAPAVLFRPGWLPPQENIK